MDEPLKNRNSSSKIRVQTLVQLHVFSQMYDILNDSLTGFQNMFSLHNIWDTPHKKQTQLRILYLNLVRDMCVAGLQGVDMYHYLTCPCSKNHFNSTY